MSVVAVKEKPILFSSAMVRAILEGRKTQTRRMVKPQPPKEIADSISHWCDTGYLYGFGKIAYSGDRKIVWPRSSGLECNSIKCPYPVGTRLWVKETWQQVYSTGGGKWACVTKPRKDSKAKLVYLADFPDGQHPPRWRSSIHMFRWASRIDLEVTGVKVERVQDISEADVFAEGVQIPFHDGRPLLAIAGPGPVAHDYLPAGAVEKGTLKIIDQPAFVRAHYAALWDTINGKGSWASNPWVWAYTFRRIDP